jgi:predicted N-acetyltransferase YhbS
MKIQIRQEVRNDFKKVEKLTYLAFKNMEFADGDEHELVAKLRHSIDFIPQLSLVAEENEKIVGHILYTSSRIIGSNSVWKSLTLAPVSVHPSYQKKGIGSMLIRKSLTISKELGHTNVNVLGHPDYYPRFGFAPASKFGITFPRQVPEEVFMMLELSENSLLGISGMLECAKEFGL